MNQLKDKQNFFEKYAVKPVKDQVSRWLTPEQDDNKLIDLIDANLANIEKEFGALSVEPKKPKRKPAPTDKNYLAQQRGPNGRFLSKKSAPVFYDSPFHVTHDKVTADEMALAVDTEIKESLITEAILITPDSKSPYKDNEVKLQEMIDKSFSKVAILTGNYVKSIDHSTEAKYTANDIREALIWGLNNHGGTMLPSKKAALYMRDRGIS